MATKKQHDAGKILQSEPLVSRLDPTSDNYTITLLRLNNWYSTEKTRADSYKYYAQYIKTHRPAESKFFLEIEERDIHITYGWMCRMLLQGANISEAHQKSFNNNLDVLLDLGKARFNEKQNIVKVVVKEDNTPKRPSIQEAMKDKISETIGELESSLDEFVTQDKDINLYNYLKSNQIPAPYVSDIKTWSQKRLDEFADVVDSKDSQLVEGYSNINKRKLKNIVKMFESFLEDCDKYGQFKKANRKPRATREKPPAVQVKSIKYKLKDDEMGLSSAKAIDLIGAEQVWLFNTKTRKLAVYVSESTKGMSVKGTALQNWSPDKSKQKTLRKPADQIKDLMVAGKVKLRTFLDDIKSKQQAVNGRINIDTIILKIIR